MIGRSKKIQDLLDRLTREGVGRTQKESEEKNVCTWCGKKIKGFKDDLSAREYQITGMCQQCQDGAFEE